MSRRARLALGSIANKFPEIMGENCTEVTWLDVLKGDPGTGVKTPVKGSTLKTFVWEIVTLATATNRLGVAGEKAMACGVTPMLKGEPETGRRDPVVWSMVYMEAVKPPALTAATNISLDEDKGEIATLVGRLPVAKGEPAIGMRAPAAGAASTKQACQINTSTRSTVLIFISNLW